MTAVPAEIATPDGRASAETTARARRRPRLRRRRSGGEPTERAGPSRLLTRLGHVALWLLVAGGAGAGVASLALRTSSSGTPPPAEPPAPTTPAEGFAELYVAAYLGQAGHGAEDAIAAFYPATVPLTDVSPARCG